MTGERPLPFDTLLYNILVCVLLAFAYLYFILLYSFESVVSKRDTDIDSRE